MKHFKLKNIYCLIAAVVLSVAAVSCDDPHDPDVDLSGDISELVPPNSVHLNCNYTIGGGRIDLTVEPYFFLDLEFWNLKVDKVTYYIDDTLCATETAAPYKFTYRSGNWPGGKHTLRADITISGKNVNTFVLKCTRDIGI